MVKFLSSWVKNLSFSLIVVSILEMLLPNNKTKKYVKVVMGLYILFSIISPFIENSDKIDFSNIDTYAEAEWNTNIDNKKIDNTIKEEYLKRLKEDVTKQAEENNSQIYENDDYEQN